MLLLSHRDRGLNFSHTKGPLSSILVSVLKMTMGSPYSIM